MECSFLIRARLHPMLRNSEPAGAFVANILSSLRPGFFASNLVPAGLRTAASSRFKPPEIISRNASLSPFTLTLIFFPGKPLTSSPSQIA
jgi:hypothetical protein